MKNKKVPTARERSQDRALLEAQHLYYSRKAGVWQMFENWQQAAVFCILGVPLIASVLLFILLAVKLSDDDKAREAKEAEEAERRAGQDRSGPTRRQLAQAARNARRTDEQMAALTAGRRRNHERSTT